MDGMKVLEYMESTYDSEKSFNVRPRVTCADGFSVSIQGGTDNHYCKPRENCNEYQEVELGFPSMDIPELWRYAEAPDNHTGTVFAYVPIDEIEKVVEHHGGIVQ